MVKKGKFYVFEGIDGSGKSTCARGLHDYFTLRNENCVLTEEPYKLGLRNIIEALFTSEGALIKDPTAELLVFAADRKLHIDAEIAPHLDMGRHVISDRYYHSMIYQVVGGADYEYGKLINKFARVPDITFVFDVKVDTVLKRLNYRSETSRFEKEKFLKEVARYYNWLPDAFPDERIEFIDANKPQDQVLEQVINLVREDLRA